MMPLAMPAGGSEKTGDDPYWDKVVFLANMNGANGSTTFIDSSPNFAAVNGNARVTDSVSLFGDSVGTFDGAGDFINLPYLSNYNLVSGNFTIEFWFRPSSLIGPQNLFEWRSSVSTMGVAFTQSFASPTKVSAFVGDSNTSAWEVAITGTTTLAVGDWYHVRLVKNGTNFQLYVNGVTQGSATSSVVPYLNSADIRFGADRGGNNGFNGQAADVMVSNIARNTSGFTPPSARLVADSNTLVLISMNGANNSVLFENIAPITKLLTPSGNAQISTANFKFGGSSGLFDGAGDYLSYGSVLPVNSNNFTVECFVYMPALPGANGFVIASQKSGHTSVGRFLFTITSAGKLNVFVGSASSLNFTGVITIPLNLWVHVAVTCSDNIYRLFVGGTLDQASAAFSQALEKTPFYISRDPMTVGADRDFNGYVDAFRCTVFARYTSDFVPPRRQLGKHSPW